MPFVNAVLWIYAFLLLILGAIGYIKDNSIISLVAGGIAGLLILGTLALYKSHPRPARIAAAVITLLLLGNFLPKAFSTPSKWHVITLAVSSLIVFLILLGAHFYAMSKKNAVFPDESK
jgi:uncharacterized membrane protein (UPF0136 family)